MQVLQTCHSTRVYCCNECFSSWCNNSSRRLRSQSSSFNKTPH